MTAGAACAVMGILNVTPDSFSDGGRYATVAAAVRQGREMFEDGAAVVDVGGESTRPGAEPVTPEEEMRRVIPVVEELSPAGPVSIDTRHAEVAEAAVRAGASIINDVSATLGHLAARLGVSWVAMHMRGSPRSMQADTRYGDVCAEVQEFLVRRGQDALRAGVPEVWLDPGIGFGKTCAQNLALIRALPALVATGFPVVVGASRKSFVGEICAERDPRRRDAGSLAVALEAARSGAALVRVHDVLATVHGLRMVEAMSDDAVGVVL